MQMYTAIQREDPHPSLLQASWQALALQQLSVALSLCHSSLLVSSFSPGSSLICRAK